MEGNPCYPFYLQLWGRVWLGTAGSVCLIDSNVHSTCCLDHWVGYVNELSMEDGEYRFFYFPWVLVCCNDDKNYFTRKITAVFKTTILLWWWTALLDSLIYTEKEELGKIFLYCKMQGKKKETFLIQIKFYRSSTTNWLFITQISAPLWKAQESATILGQDA